MNMSYKFNLKNPIPVQVGDQYGNGATVTVQASELAISNVTINGDQISVSVIPSGAFGGAISLIDCPESLREAAITLIAEIKGYISYEVSK